ncbi:MAG: hypothetical protein JJE46_01910 [Acidimicrobiia bacterium]|nr:hypothetical protein [Acidimicrobiia bacterium]
MFIDDFVSVERSILVTNSWLVSHGQEIARAAARATAPTDSLLLGPPRTRTDTLVVPISWSPRPPSSLAELQGDLLTSPLDERSTHLGLSASCLIPVEPPGRREQEFAARRNAEHSVRTFLGCLAHELEQRSASGDPSPR